VRQELKQEQAKSSLHDSAMRQMVSLKSLVHQKDDKARTYVESPPRSNLSLSGSTINALGSPPLNESQVRHRLSTALRGEGVREGSLRSEVDAMIEQARQLRARHRTSQRRGMDVLGSL